MLREIKIDKPNHTARIRYEQDVDPYLDHNADLRTQEQKSDWGKHIASVPNVILLKWLNEEWDRGNPIRLFSEEWARLIAKKLRDPDYAYLRVDGPRHSMGWSD